MSQDNPNEALWRKALLEGDPAMRHGRRMFHLLPADPRCTTCLAPFAGFGGTLVKTLMNRRPSVYNPRICTQCDEYIRRYPGGAEVELTLLFADVRGSTSLAEGMSPAAFGRLMDRYYTAATHAVAHSDGMIEKFVGDAVTALFSTGIGGTDHARRAMEAARSLLRATGHESAEGPWLPVGAGIHTGVAFVGSIGSGGVQQLAALGDAANTAARLASSAAAGEILVSEAASRAARLDTSGLEHHELRLKGQSDTRGVYVLHAGSALPI